MGLPLAGTHRPGRTHHFYWNLRRIRHIYWADRVVGPYNTPPLPVGADDSVRPQNAPAFTEIYCEFAASQRADVGIGPYRKPCKFTLDKYPIRVYSEDTPMGYLKIKRRLAYAGTQAMFLL